MRASSSSRACWIAHRAGYQHGLVYCLNGLGRLLFETGDVDRAVQAFAAARRLRAEIGIEHDPDDALVSAARAALEERLGAPVGAGSPAAPRLDAVVAGLRLPEPASPNRPEGPASRAFSSEIVIVRNASFAGISVLAAPLVTFE